MILELKEEIRKTKRELRVLERELKKAKDRERAIKIVNLLNANSGKIIVLKMIDGTIGYLEADNLDVYLDTNKHWTLVSFDKDFPGKCPLENVSSIFVEAKI